MADLTAQSLAAEPTAVTPARGLRRYLFWAALALLPGLIAHFNWHLLGRFETAMQDIHFGGGLRFWAGVAGASMMALLLLYPLRKQFLTGHRYGSVGFWYHSHIVLGLAGPVLILYHCNFGLGALNSNAALYSTLAVVVSGVVGYLLTSRFGLWRLLHLPVFAITVIATLTHIQAVWNMDGRRDVAAAPDVAIGLDVAVQADAGAEQLDVAPAPAPVAPARIVKPTETRTRVAANENGLVPAPEPASRPPGPSVAAASVQQDDTSADQNPNPPPAAWAVPAEPPLVAKPKQKLAAAPPPPLAPPANQLTQFLGVAATNDFSVLSMGNVLSGLKRLRFDHNTTRFRLTGAHTSTPCASCHTDRIKDTPKDCKSCHQKDDVHHGRRPQCGRCHSTSRW